MQIYTATNHWLQDVRSFFKGHEVDVFPSNIRDGEIDLLVFTGGEDVNPTLYGRHNRGWETNPRDVQELEILRRVLRGRLKVKKVLGICRGMQLLNVGMGGTLIYDIQSVYGRPHAPVHDIRWRVPNLFSEMFTTVNSLHHQCIEGCGPAMHYTLLGTEPTTGTPEAVLWGSKYLGVQWHPELLPDSRPERQLMADAIVEWTLGKVNIVPVSKLDGMEMFNEAWISVPPLPIDEDEEESFIPDEDEFSDDDDE